MTTKSGLTAEQLLTQGRMRLITHFPFFGSIALRLPMVESDLIPTTAVTPKGIFLWNRKFLDDLTFEDVTSIIAHEVMHIVQAFFDRKPANANHFVFNLAADQIINTAIIDGGLSSPKLLEVCPKDIQALARRDKLTEIRYFNLLKEMKEQTDCEACKEIMDNLSKGYEQQSDIPNGNNPSEKQGSQDQGDGQQDGEGNGEGQQQEGEGKGEGQQEDNGGSHSCGGHGKPHTCGQKTFCYGSGLHQELSKDEADSNTLQQWKMTLLEARQECIERGVSPGSQLEEWLDSLVKPRVDWKQYIRVQATSVFKNRYTYIRQSRRGQALNLKLPGMKPDNRSAVVFIDTSGSIGHEMMATFLSECVGILEACNCESIWVGLHDSETYSFDKLDKKGIASVRVRAGGTDHHSCFDIVEGKHEEFEITDDPAIVICLTDLYSSFPDNCSLPVIWAYPNPEGASVDVPFGKKVLIEL